MANHQNHLDVTGKPPFEEHVKNVVHNMRGSFADLLDSVGADPTRSQDMARDFNLNKNLTWKVAKVVCEFDPYTAIHHIPGKAGLDIFIRSLVKAGAPAEQVTAVREAIAEFEQMIELHAGDRETLEMMIGHLTQLGEPFRGEAYRKLSYRGNSAIWGVQARVKLNTTIIAPGKDDEWVDLAWLSGLFDFRRLRPDVSWVVASARKAVDDGTALPVGSIEAIDPRFPGDDHAPLMGDFCTQPLPRIRVLTGPDSLIRWELMEGPVGNAGAVTALIGLFGRGFLRRFRTEDDTIGEHYARLTTPVEVLVHDLFVHEDLDYAMSPQPVLQSQLPGSPLYPAHGRDKGKIPFNEKVIELGAGLAGVTTHEIPRYRQMLESVYDRAEWNQSRFHGFRLVMRYPPIPTYANLRYDLPEQP